MGVEVARRRFTVEEFHKMIDAGVFLEDDRLELLDGEIIEMTPIRGEHHSCVKRLNRWAHEALGRRMTVSVQDPVTLNERSEPYPDLMLLRYREDAYLGKDPSPEDVLLLIEVALSSANYDREVKIPHYARTGIPEAWIVLLEDEVVEVYLSPSAGRYPRPKRFRRGQTLKPTAFPDITLTVDEVLGPRS